MTENLAGRGEMTLEQFLARLAQTPRDWYLAANAQFIRRNSGECPISTLDKRHCSYYEEVARGIGMDRDLADQIANAADNGYKTELRAKLLKACGL